MYVFNLSREQFDDEFMECSDCPEQPGKVNFPRKRKSGMSI